LIWLIISALGFFFGGKSFGNGIFIGFYLAVALFFIIVYFIDREVYWRKIK
jgi:hypothetical protein